MKIPPEPPPLARRRKLWSAEQKRSRKEDVDMVEDITEVMTQVGLDPSETGRAARRDEKKTWTSKPRTMA